VITNGGGRRPGLWSKSAARPRRHTRRPGRHPVLPGCRQTGAWGVAGPPHDSDSWPGRAGISSCSMLTSPVPGWANACGCAVPLRVQVRDGAKPDGATRGRGSNSYPAGMVLDRPNPADTERLFEIEVHSPPGW